MSQTYGQKEIVGVKHQTKRGIIEYPRKPRILFLGERLDLNEDPRTGFCAICENNVYDQSCERTAIHHFEYDKENPLAHTVEVCPSCHTKIGHEANQINDIGKWYRDNRPVKICSNCGSDKTYWSFRSGGYYEKWSKKNGLYICGKCSQRHTN